MHAYWKPCEPGRERAHFFLYGVRVFCFCSHCFFWGGVSQPSHRPQHPHPRTPRPHPRTPPTPMPPCQTSLTGMPEAAMLGRPGFTGSATLNATAGTVVSGASRTRTTGWTPRFLGAGAVLSCTRSPIPTLTACGRLGKARGSGTLTPLKTLQTLAPRTTCIGLCCVITRPPPGASGLRDGATSSSCRRVVITRSGAAIPTKMGSRIANPSACWSTPTSCLLLLRPHEVSSAPGLSAVMVGGGAPLLIGGAAPLLVE